MSMSGVDESTVNFLGGDFTGMLVVAFRVLPWPKRGNAESDRSPSSSSIESKEESLLDDEISRGVNDDDDDDTVVEVGNKL